MKQILFDFFKNRHRTTKRCLGLLSFLIVALTGHKSFAQEYCVPEFTYGCGSSYISDFIIYNSGINHTNSGCSAGGYGDFTGTSSLQGSLQQGETYIFSKTSGGSLNNQQIKIWIDFNEDGDFEDDGELLFSSTLNETTTIGSFTIPLTASITSSTRLRVIANSNSLPINSCIVGYHGETQDYTVEILTAPSCQSPFAVNTFASTNYVDIDWASQGSAFQIEWGTTGFTTGNGTLISDIINTSYTINGLTSNTAYQFYIRQNCGNDSYSNWSGPYSFKTAIPGQIGDGYDTSDFPLGHNNYSYTQQIYLADELKAALDEDAVFITKIRFKPMALGSNLQNIESWTIYLGNTTKASFANTTDWVAYSDLEYVFSGNLTFEVGEWVEINLDIPFIWDGVSNLVVAVDENSPGGSWGTSFASFNTGTSRGLLFTDNNINPDPALLPSVNNGAPMPIIAQIQIEAIEPPVCNTTGLGAEVTTTTANLSWTSTGNLFEVVYGLSGFITGEGITIADINTTTTNLSGLMPDTYYDYYVRQNCLGQELLTGPYTFYTGYCIPSSLNNSGSGITGFSTSAGYSNISNLNNGTNSYTNFSQNMFVSMSENGSFNYTLNVQAFTSARIWVDWNNNLLFEDDELLVTHDPTGFADSTFLGSINIPENTPDGNYRLRIRSGGTNPCGNSNNGEVEDYTITVVPLPSCIPPVNLTATDITFTSSNISWSSSGNLFNIEYGENGFILGEGIAVNGIDINNYNLIDLEQNKDYEYYVQTDCGEDDLSVWTGPYTFYTGYCSAFSDYPEYGKIDGFSTQNGYTNISNLNNGYEVNGYSAYTEYNVTISEGGNLNYTISVIDGLLVDIWIDWNQNLIFDEDELVGQLSSAPYTGLISIPVGIAEGNYTLRIRSRNSWMTPTASPCGNIYMGETEDYTISVVPVPSCLPPTGLSVIEVTYNSAELLWANEGTLFDLEWGEIGFILGEGISVNDITVNSYILNNLEQDTTYEYYVRQNCGEDDGISIWSGPYEFYTGYCQVSTSDIEFVSFPESMRVHGFTTSGGYTNINNENNENLITSENIYNNYTNFSVTQSEGGSFNYSIGIHNSEYNQANFSIWIDWNNNMLFDEDELVASNDSEGPFSGTINIPENTSEGNYRLRLRSYYGTANPCGNIPYGGETEDYTVTIVPVPLCDAPVQIVTNNIGLSYADITWTSSGSSFDIEYGEYGFVLGTGNSFTGITQTSYTISGLNTSTTYQYYLRTNCNSDGYSLWTGPYNLKTLTSGQIGTEPFFGDYNLPVYNNGYYTYSQQIYLKEELDAVLDDEATLITTIRFKPLQVFDPQNMENWTVYLGNTVKTHFNNTGDWVPYTDLQQVFSGVISLVAGQWVEINLHNPFEWDGISNLVVVVDENSPGQSGGTWESFNSGTIRGNFKDINYNPDPAWLPEDFFQGDTTSVIPVIQIESIEIPACYVNELDAVISNDSTELLWGSTGNLFDIEWGESGFVLGEGTSVNDIIDNSYILTELDDNTYYQYYVRQNCGNDLNSNWTGPFTFYTGYCIPSLEYPGETYKITGVTTSGGYTNIYNEDNGTTNDYSDFTDFVVSQSQGGSFQYQFSVMEYTILNVWIDWNNNFVFDQDELIIEYGVVDSPTTFTGTINIPENIPDGNYRMRLRTRSLYGIAGLDVTAGPCGEQYRGEAEDYTISVNPAPACMAPQNLDAVAVSTSLTELSWISNGSLFEVEYGEEGFTLGEGTPVTGITTNSVEITGIAIDTTYQYYVRMDCGDDDFSTWAGPYKFFNGYCEAFVTSPTSFYISSFTTTGGINNIVNTTGPTLINGYSNYTDQSVEHFEGGNISFTVTTNSESSGLRIWIDWNNNLQFDTDELIFMPTQQSNNFSGSFYVPLGTPTGDYRMRIRADYQNLQFSACGEILYGEIEDYTVTVSNPPSCLPVIEPGFANISSTDVLVFWQSNGELFDIEYGEDGFIQGEGIIVPEVENNHIISGLTTGGTYEYYVRQNCGNNDYSIWNGPIVFTPELYQGHIPTMLNANPQIDDNVCAYESLSIVVPDGQQIVSLTVQYMMTSSSPAYTSHQRSVLYSSTLGMGEVQVVSPSNPQDYPGVVPYSRNIDFANGATGTVDFELKAWRTEGGSGCGTDLVYVEDGSWILIPEFEDIPSCPNPPADLGYTNITEDSVDLVWTSDESGTFQILWGNVGFNIETEGTSISDITTYSQTLSDLDATIPYEFYVRRDCSTDDEEDFGEWVGPVRFNSGHCIPYATQGYYFTVFDTSNALTNITYSYPSGSPLSTGYVDSTEDVIIQEAGESFDFTANYSGGASDLRIWVDWNNNFIFEDDEQVFFLTGGGAKNGTITIPVGTPGGDYRMRVRAQSGVSTPPACGVIGTGEALDFTLRISCEEVATPTGDETQPFEAGDTLADLDVTGDNLVWYADEDLTIVLNPTTELVHNTTYYVVSSNGGCQSEYLAVTVEQTSSVSDFNSFGFRYYPNPVSELLYLSANAPISDVKVINMLGQQVNAPANSDNTNVDVSGLPTGNYLMQVTIEGVSKMLKVVKQ